MVSAAELIEALQRRMQLVAPHRRRPAGEFPPGWQAWLAEMGQRAGAVTGSPASAIIGLLATRPPTAPQPAAPLLNRWQSFNALWRQQWHPPGRDERGTRWFAAAVSVLWHVVMGGLLLWLMYVQYLHLAAPPQGETVVQVEYIGQGTSPQVGGGPAQPEPDATAASSPATDASQPAAAVAPALSARMPDVSPTLQAAVPDIPQRDVPEPQRPAPSVEQPVTVSEPAPDTATFVLPPATARTREPSLATRELAAVLPQVEAVEVPEPVQPIARELPSRDLSARPIQARDPQVAQRDIPVPLPRASVRELPPATVRVPDLAAPTAAVRQRDVPAVIRPVAAAQAARPDARSAAANPARSPSPSTAPAASTPATSTQAANAPSATAARPAESSSAASGNQAPAAASPGTGPKPVSAAGGWPTPGRADDWGDSSRNRPGGQRGIPSGVYNSDGSIRLGDAPGSASPGRPPGTITQEIANLDRAGTWLKRKPNDFEPTSFNKYWRPNETLLAEWVRKSVTTVRIPIPGTRKTLICQTVLLAMGGGCDISDPNLNDQPAQARPPPDIPFKPYLQEDNGAVKP